MKTIESKEDFIAWANEINRGVSLSRKCDMQDIYAHSNRLTLDRLFVECKGDRKLLICSVNNCMAFDEVEHLLGVLAKAKVAEEYQVIDKEYEKLNNAKAVFEESKRAIYRRIKELSNRATQAIQQRDNYNAKLIHTNSLVKELRVKAEKFDALKNLLK